MKLRSATIGILRLLAAAATVGAALDVPLPARNPAVHVAYVLDISDSVRAAGRFDRGRSAEDALVAIDWDVRTHLRGDDRVSILLFGAQPVPLMEAQPVRDWRRPSVLAVADSVRWGTDIGRALEAARARKPDRIVLLTDGQATNAYELGPVAGGPPVDVVPLGPLEPADGRVVSVSGPMRVAEGERFEIVVRCSGTASMQRTVRAGDLAREIRLEPGIQSEVVLGPFIGPQRVDVVLEPPDAIVENDRGAWWAGPRENVASVLVVTRGESRMANALSGEAWAKVDVAPELSAPEEYALVILENIAAPPVPAQERLVRYIRTGGALLWLGGPESYAAGGYAGGPLEDHGPLWVVPGDTAAVVFAVDRSSSMAQSFHGGATSKFDAAIAAIERAVASLRPRDFVGFVAFHGNAEPLAPLRPVMETPPVAQVFAGVAPRGPTRIAPALYEAAQMLAGTQAPIRHVVLVTDGETREQVGDEIAQAWRAVEATGAELTAAITSEREWEKWRDRGVLIRSSDDLEHALADALARTQGWYLDAPRAVTDGVIGDGLDPTPPPARVHRLGARPEAIRRLDVDGYPFVAERRLGAGRIVACAFALRDDWGSGEDVTRLAVSIARELARSGRPAGSLEILPDPAGARVRMAPIPQDGRVHFGHESGEPAGAAAVDPYDVDTGEALLPLARQGTYAIWTQNGSRARFVRAYDREWERLGPDREALRRIAEASGGALLETTRQWAERSRQRVSGKRPGRPWFLGAAIVSFIAAEAAATLWPNRFRGW